MPQSVEDVDKHKADLTDGKAWQPIDWTTVRAMWSEHTDAFICTCGQEVILSEAGDRAVCRCGQAYRLEVCVEVARISKEDGYALENR